MIQKLPSSICRSCRKTLFERERGIFTRLMPKMPNFENLVNVGKELRQSQKCICYICKKARYKGHKKIIKGRGRSKYLLQKSNKNKTKVLLCSACLGDIAKGKKHICTKTVAYKNTVTMLKTVPHKIKEKVVTSVIRDKLDLSNKSLQNIHFNLSTEGNKSRIVLNPLKHNKEKTYFFHENLDRLQLSLGSSNNQMKKISRFLRASAGKLTVTSDYEKHLSVKTTLLNNLYRTESYEFDIEGDVGKEKRPVVYTTAEEIIERVVSERRIVGYYKVKVTADGGQGFFKICLTILCDTEENQKTKKNTGIYKIIMLCVVPNIKETHNNIQFLFELTKLNNLSFKFVADFKIILLVNGHQSASSMYPCPYCFVPKNDFRKELFKPQEEQPELKTYGDIQKFYQKFVTLHDGDKKKC